MGFRTVVIFDNDRASEWQNDPELGKKIMHAMHGDRLTSGAPFGSVVECTHADSQSLIVIDSFSFTYLASSQWRSGESDEDRDLRLLKEAANKRGYRLTKKSKAKIGDLFFLGDIK
jgi:hypothetical protein